MTIKEWMVSQNAINAWKSGNYVLAEKAVSQDDADASIGDANGELMHIKRIHKPDLSQTLKETDQFFMIPNDSWGKMIQTKQTSKVFMANPDNEIGYNPDEGDAY